jgi:hypothetical protein
MSIFIGTLAGAAGSSGSTDATGATARFNNPYGVAVDTAGVVYVADSSNHTIRKITTAGVVSTLAGTAGSSGSTDGTGSAARFKSPRAVAVDTAGVVYVGDSVNRTIRKITTAGVVSTLAGTPGSPSGLTNGTGAAAGFGIIGGVAVDTAGVVYVADGYGIRKITTAGVVSTLAGTFHTAGWTDGTGAAARFNTARGVAVDTAGVVYVADTLNHSIRKITPAGVVSTLAGAGPAGDGSTNGTGASARFAAPEGVAVDTAGVVYVADSYNSTIRKITTAGVVTTEAGSPGLNGSNDGYGSAARFNIPYGVAVDTAGVVYVGERHSHTIRKSQTSVAGAVTLSNLTFTFDGTAKIPTTTVSPPGVTVQLAYTGTATSLSAPVSAGSYVVTATIIDNLFTGSTAGVVTISKASQTITFASIPTKFEGSGAFVVAPSSNAGLTVALASSNEAVATVSGFEITPIAAGTVTISATQAGNTNYDAAATVNQAFAVVAEPIAQSIDFPALSPRKVANLGDIYAQAQALATATSLSFTDATTIAQANARSVGSFQLVATASSGLPVTFTSTATAVALVTGNICTPVTPGVTNIVASQAGNSAFSAASSVTRTLLVVERQMAWLDIRWELSDLQVNLVTRAVTSNRRNGAVLQIRQGDDHSLAVFLTDAAGAALPVNPSALKVTIREPKNREPVILEVSTFTAQDFGGLDPYYLMDFSATNDSLQRYVAFASRPDNSDAIPALGQVEWVYDGKVYSSKPFSVLIVPEVERELDEV